VLELTTKVTATKEKYTKKQKAQVLIQPDNSPKTFKTHVPQAIVVCKRMY